jgi:O-antigen/teichoic acid export membrane protein
VAAAAISVALSAGHFGQAEVLMADGRKGVADYAAARFACLITGLVSTLAALTYITWQVSWSVAIVSVLFLPFLIQANLWRSNAIMTGATRPVASSSFFANFLRVPIVVGSAIVGKLNVEVAVAASQWTASLVTYRFLARLPVASNSGNHAGGIGRRTLRALRRGSPMLAFDTFTAINLSSAVFVLSATGTSHELGVYSAVYAVGALGLAVSAVFKNRIQAAFFAGSGLRLKEEMTRLVAVSAIGIVVSVSFADPATRLLFGDDYTGSATMLRVMSVQILGTVFLDIVHGVLIVLDLRHVLVMIAGVGAAVSVSLNVLLIPSLGAIGAVAGSTTGVIVAATAGCVVVRRSTRWTQGTKGPLDDVAG